jgi:small subunit ribosomal protein S20
LANHKSALKRMRQSEKARIRNKSNRSRMKTYVKKVLTAISEGSPQAAQDALKAAMPMIDRAATKGAIKRGTASRKVARLSKAVHRMTASN